jgi:tetratricopeptide (TPR) repeat protein
LDFSDDGRALGVTDWDQDGDLDVWLGNRTGPRLRLMRNSTIDGAARHTEHGFVALRLRGTKSNRDAVGARVTVELLGKNSNDPVPVLIQTLRAGDAYLSQSSKWLHFGLGSDTDVAKVEVRWPSGLIERFSNVRAGERYELVEGSGQAKLLPRVARTIALEPRQQESLPISSVSRTYFSNRVPMPLVAYKPFDESEQRAINVAGRPLLVTFWASWCEPCLVELHEMTRQADLLRKAGMDVLALSVDGLDSSQSTTPVDARAALERLAFPFSSGMATREMFDKFSVVESIMFNYDTGLVVPASYLFDSQGHLAVAYKGRIDLAQLQQDVAQLDVPLAERRSLSAPLPGRWISRPRQLLMRAVANTFRGRGYDDDFARYMKLDTEMIERQLAGARSEEQRQELTGQLADSHFNLGMTLFSSGDFAEAANFFQRTIELDPNHVEALVNLGGLLGRARSPELAVKTLQRAVELKPDSIPARVNLAAALTASGQFAAAVPHYEAILASEPNNASAHSQLARSLIELSQIESAVEHLDTAVRLNPKDFAATLTLAWLQATSPIEGVRNGNSALKLARQLQTTTGGQNLMVLDLLAAAAAEQRDFEAATSTIRDGLALLGDRNPSLRQIFLARLKQYEAQLPHRDEDGRYP